MRGSGRVNLARSFHLGGHFCFQTAVDQSQGRAAGRPLHRRPALHSTWSPTTSASSTQHMVPPHHRPVLHSTWSPTPSASSTQHMVPHNIGQFYTAHGPPQHRPVLHSTWSPLTIGQFYTWSPTPSASSTHGPSHHRPVLHNTWSP